MDTALSLFTTGFLLVRAPCQLTVISRCTSGLSLFSPECVLRAAGMVALPTADLPLQIFEARYRVLFHTLIGEGKGYVAALCFPHAPPGFFSAPRASMLQHAQSVQCGVQDRA